MDDLLGFGKGTEKLLSTIEKAFGAAYRPLGLRREADAEAYRIGAVEAAKLKARTREMIELAKTEKETGFISLEGRMDLEERLQARLKHQSLQEQTNIDSVVAGATNQVPPNPTSEEVDPDWLRGFFEHARNVSNEQMQVLWSRVLALEVGIPGTFSPKALDVLRKMTRREASAFQKACRLASSFSEDRPRTSIYRGATRDAWFQFSLDTALDLHGLGLPYLDQVNLSQIGLLYEKHLISGKFERNEEVQIYFASTRLRLKAKRSDVMLQNYSLTPIGGELAALISPDEDAAYITALTSRLSKYFHVHNDDIANRVGNGS